MLKISIITATYNSASTLETAILSVATQTYPNIEYIIVDGGSKDATLNIIQKHANTIYKFVSEPDKGIYDALNKGIEMATGDVIGFLHSDDILGDDDIIEKIAYEFSNHKLDAIYGDLEYVRQYDTNHIIRYWESKTFHPKMLKQGWMPAHPTLYVRKDWYRQIGVFNLDFKIAADYDFILRLFSQPHLKTSYIPQVIVKMRVGGESNKSIKNLIRKTQEDIQALRNNKVGGIRTVFIKNISKLPQFFVRKQV